MCLSKGAQSKYGSIYYALDPNKFYNCHDCRSDLGLMGGDNVSRTQKNMVDLESDLVGITRPNSLCPERKYLPHCQKCSEMSGLPCVGSCKNVADMKHLKECSIIEYGPRLNHVGYDIKYPACQKITPPPQFNPTHLEVKSNL